MNLDDDRKVVDFCKYYNLIIEERFTKDDTFTPQIIRSYKFVVNHSNKNNPLELNYAILADESVYSYFNDEKFNNLVLNSLNEIQPGSSLLNFVINKFQQYKNDPNNKLSATKWL